MLIPLEEVGKLPGDLWKVNNEVFCVFCFAFAGIAKIQKPGLMLANVADFSLLQSHFNQCATHMHC